MDNYAATQVLVGVFLLLDVFQQGIVLLRCLGVAVLGLCVEKKHLAVLHPYHEIDIEERLHALTVGVWHGIVLPSGIAVLVPPVNRLAVAFKKLCKLVLWH